MAERHKNLFVDTNTLIHFKNLRDIDWRVLFPDVSSVDVLISKAVIGELDRHKNSRRDRLRARSRAALKLIREARLEPGMALQLRKEPVLVRLVVARVGRID